MRSLASPHPILGAGCCHFWFILAFSFAWFDSGYMFGVPLVFVRPLVSDSHLCLVSYLLLPFPAIFWYDSGYMLCHFTEAWEFHAFSA